MLLSGSRDRGRFVFAMASRKGIYGFMGPVVVVMLFAIVLAFAAFVFGLASKISQVPFGYGSEALFVNLSILGIGFIVGVFIFYKILQESINVGVRIAVALFVFSAVMSLLIYLRLLFSYYGFSTPLLHFGLTIVAYLCGFMGVMAIFDVLSTFWRNMLFAICSSTIGAFIGAVAPTVGVILILLIFAVLDLVLVRKEVVKRGTKMNDDYEKIVLKMSYAGKDWAIGLADLVCYAMLVANCFAHFGFVAAIGSLVLVVVGALLASREALRLTQVAGLPYSVALGLIPVFVYMFIPGLP
jgi:hypothetical protein